MESLDPAAEAATLESETESLESSSKAKFSCSSDITRQGKGERLKGWRVPWKMIKNGQYCNWGVNKFIEIGSYLREHTFKMIY